MKIERQHAGRKPERMTGIRHVFDVAAYFLRGIWRLWREIAFRHIVLAFIPSLALLVGIGTSGGQFSVVLILFFRFDAVEALNTTMRPLRQSSGALLAGLRPRC